MIGWVPSWIGFCASTIDLGLGLSGIERDISRTHYLVGFLFLARGGGEGRVVIGNKGSDSVIVLFFMWCVFVMVSRGNE